MTPATGHLRQISPEPVCGLASGTPVLTLDGELPVDYLAPGDRVVTRSGSRTLAGISVNVLSDAPMMRITGSSSGPGLPAAGQLVSPGQPIRLRDWRARVFAGSSVAMVPAARLADGEFFLCETLPSVRLFSLHFAQDEVIFAGGMELACAPA